MQHWRETWAGIVRTPDDLVRFVDGVGCCTLAPLPRYPDFPNQAEAMGTHREAAPDLWFWKDDLHIEKRLYYTFVFGGRPGYVSHALLPALIATNGAVADELLFTGGLSPEAREVYQVIEANGPVASKALKRQLSPEAHRRANQALEQLERRFIITKVGLTGRTRGTYSYIWDLVERWVPDALAAADRLGRAPAAATLCDRFAGSGVAADSAFYAKVLGWEPR